MNDGKHSLSISNERAGPEKNVFMAEVSLHSDSQSHNELVQQNAFYPMSVFEGQTNGSIGDKDMNSNAPFSTGMVGKKIKI